MSIFRRGRFWHYDFEEGGRRHWGSTKKTNKREAERFVTALRADIVAQADAGAKGTIVKTLAQVCALYEAERLPALRSNNVVGVHKRLMGALGGETDFNRLDPGRINRFIDARVASGVPANTVRLEYNRFVALVNWLADAHPHIKLPERGKARLPKATSKIRILNNADEEAALWASLRECGVPRWLRFSTLLLDTGMRCGEASSLTWDGVHIDARRLRIYREKTDSISILPMTDRLAGTLEEIRREQPRSCPWVFPREDLQGPMLRKSKTLDRAIDGSGINAAHIVRQYGRFTPHSFRHTYATRLIRQGISPVVVQRLMGHAKLETTMIYVNLVAEDGVDDALAALNSLSGVPT